MHCYFDIVAPNGIILDRNGVEAADFDQALEEALSVIREMREEDPASARACDGCELRIIDGSGLLLASVALDHPAPRHQNQPPPRAYH